MHTEHTTEKKNNIRSIMREQRNALSLTYQSFHAPLILDKLISLCQNAQHIGLYYPIANEVDIRPLWRTLHQIGISTYLPVIQENKTMCFSQFNHDTIFHSGQFNIPIPQPFHYIDTPQLDIVLVPLLACDQRGQRIGMGAGFYDRTFAFIKAYSSQQQPHLIGVGWDFQYLSRMIIEAEQWDIPLNCFISENYHLNFTVQGASLII